MGQEIHDEARIHFLFRTAGISNHAFDLSLLLDVSQTYLYTLGPTHFLNAYKSHGVATLNITILIEQHKLKEYVSHIPNLRALVPGRPLYESSKMSWGKARHYMILYQSQINQVSSLWVSLLFI